MVDAKPETKPDEKVVPPAPVTAKTDDAAPKVDDKAAEPKKPFEAAALGANYGGNTAPSDPQRTRNAIDAALSSELPAGAIRVGDHVQLVRGDREALLVSVEVATEEINALSPVVEMKSTGRDRVVIRVVSTATPEQVQRAVAGKLAELAHVSSEAAAGRRADTTSALTEGSQATELSPEDHNKLGQIKTALHQLDAAQAKGDKAGAEQIRRDAYALVVGMGLVETAPAAPIHPGPGGKPMSADGVRVTGPEASARRLTMIDEVLGGDAAKLRELVAGARADAPAIADIRTQRAAAQERLRAKCKELMAERQAANAALRPVIDAALGADGTGAIFERIIVGGGWAGTADYATMQHGAGGVGGVPPVLVLSHGGDPWAGRGELLMGQNNGELEMRGMSVQPGDLAKNPHEFTTSGDFSDAVGASAAVSGMPSYDASVSKIEHRPESEADGWPDGARYRITANGRSFYAKSVDVVSGPGPARVPGAGRRIADPSGYAIDAHTGDYYHHQQGLREEFVKVDAKDVPDDVKARLEGERGRVSTTFVDQKSGFKVDASKTPEVVYDKDNNIVAMDKVPEDVRQRLGIHGGRQRGDGPALVDQDGRPQTSRVYDPESKCAVDVLEHKVYGPDGKLVDPATLAPDVRTRLGFNADGTFRDPRFVPATEGRSVNPVTGEVIDSKTGTPVDVTKLSPEEQKALTDVMDKHRVKFGGTLLAGDYAPTADGKTPNVLIYGAGASGAWDLEQANQGGANSDWAGRMRLPKPDQFPEGSKERAAFIKLHDETTPVEERRQLLVDMRDIIVKETLKDGHNRRNSVPGLGAYSPEVLGGGRVEQSARTIVDLQQTTDGRFYARFSDGTEGVYDKAIMSIGQDSNGEGGVGAITKGMRLNGLRGTSGELMGAVDESGTLRILGAAGMGPTINRLTEDDQSDASKQAKALPSDSRNIGVSIRGNAGRIAASNEQAVGGESPVEMAKRSELERSDPQTADALFTQWKQQQLSPKSVESKAGPDAAVEATHAWEQAATATFQTAFALQEKLIAKLRSETVAEAFIARVAKTNAISLRAARTLVDDFRTTPFERAMIDVGVMAQLLVEHAEDPKNERHRVTIPAPNDRFSSSSVTSATQQMSAINLALPGFDAQAGFVPAAPVVAVVAPPPPVN